MVMGGDLGSPGLGLTAEDRATLVREVHYIVHSAASISFVDHIHNLISHNYIVSCRPSAACGVRQSTGMPPVCLAWHGQCCTALSLSPHRPHPVHTSPDDLIHASCLLYQWSICMEGMAFWRPCSILVRMNGKQLSIAAGRGATNLDSSASETWLRTAPYMRTPLTLSLR